MNTRITIKDIAKAVGCSANCVSRALMNAPDISESTKQKVRRYADELGYVYNRHAAGLRAGNSRTVGILFDSLLNPFYFVMTNYIWERLDKEGYSIVTLKNNSAEFGETTVRQILSDNVAGLLSFLQPTEQAQREIDNNSLPTVVIGRKTHGKCDCIYLDDVQGGRLAANRFLELGRKKPMYLGEIDTLECSMERGKGFAEEFGKHGINADLHFLGDGSPRKYTEFFEKIIGSGDIPDCVFCFSDMIAYEIISVMERHGIRNTDVIGYDNIQKEIFLPGALTSIDYDKKEMVDRAVTDLLDKINGRSCESIRETCISVRLADGKQI